ncbi:MAG TPA: pitrilysin family protein [Pyrinomonadaceae bacterium]|jgi:predicted Zn-dependent peptidase
MSQTETTSEAFRQQPPAPLAPRPLNLPAGEEVTLANGLRVVFVEQRRLPLVSLRLAFGSGDAHDPPELPGLTDVMAVMLNEGTTTRTSRQIADETARIGATLSAGANSDYMTVGASALTQFADEILELVADVVLRPSFPEDELELTKQNALQNLIAQRGQPAFLANERIARVLYGAHPYAVVAPTPESIGAMTRARLAEFHREAFIPNNAVLVIGGDVERTRMRAQLENLFGAWPRGPIKQTAFPAPPARARRSAYIVDRPGSAQSNIVIANAGIPRTHPDYFPLLLMHTVLGANASSRLFMNLREEKGYTYGAYTNLDARREAGSFRATAEVRTAVTGASLKEFFGEFARIRAELVSDQELQDAKAYLTGIFPIRLETLDGLIDQLIQIKMFGLPDDYLQTYRDRVQAVTREDVQRAAHLYVTPDAAAVVVVGDAAAITDQVREYATDIEFYDSMGQRKRAAGTDEGGNNGQPNG